MSVPSVKPRYWSEEDYARLRTLFEEGKSDAEIAAALGRGVPAVLFKRSQLKLRRGVAPSSRAWSEEEIQIVKDGIASQQSYPEIAQKLPKRTISQVREFAYSRLNHQLLPKVKRWTQEEDDLLTREFLAYRPRNEIATMLRRSGGVVQQRIRFLGLRRDTRRALLARRFDAVATDPRPTEEIYAAIEAKDKADQEARSIEERAAVDAALAELANLLQMGASRRPAFQQAMKKGATLQEIGDVVGLTRERVRQIVYGVANRESLDRLVFRLVALNPRDYAIVTEAVERMRNPPNDLAVDSGLAPISKSS